MKLGSVEVEPTVSRREIFTGLLWGKPTVGKTILASTAPGKKLWLQFDPAGTASLARSTDILVADFAGFKPIQLEAFKQGGVIEADLLKGIKADGVDTVVVDSLTSFGQMALAYAVMSGKGNRGTFKCTLEQPGQTGYGVRSAMLLDFVSMVLRVCSDSRCHCIFVAHDREELNDDGTVKGVTISIGGQGQVILPAKISELWFVEDTGRERSIYVRNHFIRYPMRTRMFNLDGNVVKFPYKYDHMKETGEGIAHWYERWQTAGFNRIPLPV